MGKGREGGGEGRSGEGRGTEERGGRGGDRKGGEGRRGKGKGGEGGEGRGGKEVWRGVEGMLSVLSCLVQGMGAMLRSAVQSSPPDLVSQLNYIVEQLNCDTAGDTSTSDTDDDDNDDGDDDEEVRLHSVLPTRSHLIP